ELSFLICGIIKCGYVRSDKKESIHIFKERNKGITAILAPTVQFCYVFAMTGNAIIAAPLIAAYGIFSVILSIFFLKEVMSTRQYIMIAVVMIGIILLGFSDA